MWPGDISPGGPAPYSAVTGLCPGGLPPAPAGRGFQQLLSGGVEVPLSISHCKEAQASGAGGIGRCEELTVNTLAFPTRCDHIDIDVSPHVLLSYSSPLQTLFSPFPVVFWSGAASFPQDLDTLSAQGRGLPLMRHDHWVVR